MSEAMERERVERMLRDLREGHDEEYRRAILVGLFDEGLFEPINGYVH